MNNIHLLLPKQNRPVFTPGLEEVALEADFMSEIPLLGMVTAGLPVDLCSENEQVSVPSNMVRKNTYALRVQGHSMIDDNIQDGDLIVVEKKQTAENGQTVVAMINGEQVTLKKFYVERDGIRLQPANPDMQPIILKNDEIEILGIVTGVIRPMD
ncbi:MAG: transcriptional repressor LexA [Gammaproteobacteria bacterium]|jgi:repressor LexA|nr:transcriptional repressor LexA [Gammaproteobacteria bacterium]